MRSFTKTLALCTLAACRLGSNWQGSEPTQWTVVSGAVCAPDGGSLILRVAHLETLFDTHGKVVVPKMQLVLGGTASDVVPIYNQDSQTFSVKLPPNSVIGYYDVIITRASDGAKETVSGALQILGAPVITGVSEQAACSIAETQVFYISGSNFGPQTSVTLAGDSAPVPSSVDPGGSKLTVRAPTKGHTASASYAITVSNGGPTCVATSANGFTVKAPPTATVVLAGPHLKSGKLAQNAAVTVRVTGTSVSGGSVVTVGSVASISAGAVAGDANSVDAIFAPGALALGGGQAVTVANGPCVSHAAPSTLDVAAPDMTIDRLSPTGWVAGQQGVFFDAFGSLSAAGLAPTLWIDMDASPFTEQWQSVSTFVRLDATGNAVRFANASGPSPISPSSTSGATNVSVTSADGVHEAFVGGGVMLQAAPAPRMIWKDKDWVNANGSVSDSLTVYGCDLASAGTQFKLIQQATPGVWVDVPNGALTASASTDAAWGAAKLKCTDGDGVGDQASAVTLTTQATLAKGVYRIRALVPAAAGVAEVDEDDLYPLVGYDTGALALGTFTLAAPALSASRKNAQATVAADATGRKYAYVLGGSAVSTSDPSDAGGATETTYEFSPLDPDHGLVGFVHDSSTGDTTWNFSPSSFKATYGGAVASDGTFIYWVGGTSNSATAGSSSPDALQSMVTDPTMTPGAVMGKLENFVVKTTLCSAFTTSCTGLQSVYGAKAVVLHNGATRTLAVIGGFTTAQNLKAASAFSLPLDAMGLVPLSGPNTLTIGGLVAEAPSALIASENQTSLYSVLGYFSPEVHAQQTLALTGSPAATTQTVSGLPNPATCGGSSGSSPCLESGQAVVAVGTKVFLLGGTDRYTGTLSGPPDWDASRPRQGGFAYDPALGGAATATTKLYRRLSLGSQIFIPPMVYLLSGIVCSADNLTPVENPAANSADCGPTGARVLTQQIETATIR